MITLVYKWACPNASNDRMNFTVMLDILIIVLLSFLTGYRAGGL